MNFPYTSSISIDPDTGDPMLLLRPEIEVRIGGPNGFRNYLALVDTGADNTIFPRSAAVALGIPLRSPRGGESKSFGGHAVTIELGEAEIEISESNETYRWSQRVHFFDFSTADEEVAILGHAGFLEFFTATFNGEFAWLELVPNSTLPSA
jgi:hypothetical protein